MDINIVLGIVFLIVTVICVISVIRQLKIKNILALLFSLAATVVFGFFSLSTIACQFMSNNFCG